MQPLLEISGNDIKLLPDDKLRELIGLLCEADCRAMGSSPHGVTWGGNQDAKDGGLDVMVSIGHEIKPSFIPRSSTGFQVKKPDMSKAAVLNEMKPYGMLRDVIKSLIQAKGAYVLISSGSSASHKALSNRLEAMKEAVSHMPDHEQLLLDFYDSGRVASWVRTHPSLILWVRKLVGRQLNGWQPYENWSHSPAGMQDKYLLDDRMRLYDGTAQSNQGEMSVTKGFNTIRSLLSVPRTCLRLVGLSGVGKTRFVQALFDNSIETNALDPSLAIYTDMSNSPDPNPTSMAEQLIAMQAPSVLIIDNCSPELHRTLTNICSVARSTLSLITVEYDVRDDLPEETIVFRLEPAGDDLIIELIGRRFNHISDVDIRTIAQFSGGNARIALALAGTVAKGNTLSGFRDEQLFERLFDQGNSQNPQLLKSAQVCSLVYSFDGTNTTANISELAILSSLILKLPEELYSDMAELRNRSLVQARHVWRAILPQAIANRLAKKALDSIPIGTIESKFRTCGSERLLKSFCRRLSFLHDSDIAVNLVETWLQENGWLGDAGNFNKLGMDLFEIIAPVSPVKTLEAIERAVKSYPDFTARSHPDSSRFIDILRCLAFDQHLFIKSVRIICEFAVKGDPKINLNASKFLLKSLFQLQLSGTHATIEDRYSIIYELIESDFAESRELGLFLLGSSLEAWHFHSRHSFEFGARPRDYGYAPKSVKEAQGWYSFFIRKCVELALSVKSYSEEVRSILAENFRGMWLKAGMHDDLIVASERLRDVELWPEGWVSVKQVIKLDSASFDAETIKKLVKLERLLKATDLSEKIQTYALADRINKFEILEVCNHSGKNESTLSEMQRFAGMNAHLGMELGNNKELFDRLLPALVSKQGIGLFDLGRGVAIGTKNRTETWDKLSEQIVKTEQQKRNITFMVGFISEASKSDVNFGNKILDKILMDPVLQPWFVAFQTRVPLDQRAIQRLNSGLDLDLCPVESYDQLAGFINADPFNDENLAQLVHKIMQKEAGHNVALQIFISLKYVRASNNSMPLFTPSILAQARYLFANFKFPPKRDYQIYYNLQKLAEVCLSEPGGAESAEAFCKNLAEAFRLTYIYLPDLDDILTAVARIQPLIFLDAFLGDRDMPSSQKSMYFSYNFDFGENPLNVIPDDDILKWCRIDPAFRYSVITGATDLFDKSTTSNVLEWKPIVFTILQEASDLQEILDELANSLHPTSWSNSLADILEKRIVLLDVFLNHHNQQIVSWARKNRTKIMAQIAAERKSEDERLKERYESFE